MLHVAAAARVGQDDPVRPRRHDGVEIGIGETGAEGVNLRQAASVQAARLGDPFGGVFSRDLRFRPPGEVDRQSVGLARQTGFEGGAGGG